MYFGPFPVGCVGRKALPPVRPGCLTSLAWLYNYILSDAPFLQFYFDIPETDNRLIQIERKLSPLQKFGSLRVSKPVQTKKRVDNSCREIGLRASELQGPLKWIDRQGSATQAYILCRKTAVKFVLWLGNEGMCILRGCTPTTIVS